MSRMMLMAGRVCGMWAAALVLLSVAGVSVASVGAEQPRVKLRSAALVEAGRPVTLGDVARLEGAAADLAGVIVHAALGSSGSAPVALSVEDVRRRVYAAGHTAVQLAWTGRRCTVYVKQDPAGSTPAPRVEAEAQPVRTAGVDRERELNVVRPEPARSSGVRSEAVRERSASVERAVRSGQLLEVVVRSAGFEIVTTAYAMDAGAVGEVIACRIDRRSTPFRAVITGPGRVVVER